MGAVQHDAKHTLWHHYAFRALHIDQAGIYNLKALANVCRAEKVQKTNIHNRFTLFLPIIFEWIEADHAIFDLLYIGLKRQNGLQVNLSEITMNFFLNRIGILICHATTQIILECLSHKDPSMNYWVGFTSPRYRVLSVLALTRMGSLGCQSTSLTHPLWPGNL
jgi:hypothetical protein